MTELEHRLRHLVDEGTRIAKGPPPAALRRRLRRRRTVTTTVIALAASALALPFAVSRERVDAPAGPPGTRASLAASPSAEAVTVRPTVVGRGQPVSVTGARCRPGQPVTFSLASAAHPRDLGMTTADQHGAYIATVTIPADALTGTATLWAACKAANPADNPAAKLALPATIEIS
jgi:hypothetical protein